MTTNISIYKEYESRFAKTTYNLGMGRVAGKVIENLLKICNTLPPPF
jgi:hypothetical protein